MKRVALVLCALPLAPAPAHAVAQAAPQPPAPLQLGVEDAVSRAIAASPRLARLGDLETAAEAQRRGAAADRWPQVDVGGGYRYRSAIPPLTIFAPTGDPTRPFEQLTVFPNIQNNYQLRAGLAVPIYTGGRISGQIDAADKGREAARQDLNAARADLVLETKTAYWNLVTARAAERVLQDAIKAFEAHLVDTRNRERFGMAARNEVLAVEVERDSTELDRLRASAGADLAEANLRRLLDLPPATRVEPTEALEAPPAVASDLEPLVSEAAAGRAERAALLARASAAEALVGVEHGGRLPQVALTAGYTYANPNRDIVPPTTTWTDTWDVGASFAWSVFDGGKRSASQARARAQADAAQQQLRELDRAIRLEVTERVLELRTAAQRLSVADRGLDSARENRKVAQDRYREGVIPSSELLDAETALRRAELSRTEALASLRLAAAGLDRAVGR
jgi:outer membrane protein